MFRLRSNINQLKNLYKFKQSPIAIRSFGTLFQSSNPLYNSSNNLPEGKFFFL